MKAAEAGNFWDVLDGAQAMALEPCAGQVQSGKRATEPYGGSLEKSQPVASELVVRAATEAEETRG